MFLPFRRSLDRKRQPFTTDLLSSRRSRRRAALRRRCFVEQFEGRQVLSTFNVTIASDNGNNTSPLAGSLRAAIIATDALTAGTYSTIDFQISGSGLHEIELKAPLPAITNPVKINGLSQTGSTATSPLIQIDGTGAGSSAVGLDFASSASGTAANPTQVSGLEITDFDQGGAFSSDASYVDLEDLSVGLMQTGGEVLVAGNGLDNDDGYGVEFSSGSHDTLSGSVVSGNFGTGVIASDTSYATLTGDFIGTDVTGDLVVDSNGNFLGNRSNGVLIDSVATYTIVTKTVVANNDSGVVISDSGTEHNSLTADDIGTNSSGSSTLGNLEGVVIQNGATYNTVGGTVAGSGNVISGNSTGVNVVGVGTTANVVEGNDIGLNPKETQALANFDYGVFIGSGATGNTIGGTATTVGGSLAGAGNVISGNGAGVTIWEPGTEDNVVAGDYIGTDPTGALAIGNTIGVELFNGAVDNTIGGTTAGTRDVISGNTNEGIDVGYVVAEGGVAAGNVIEGDYIGVNAAGSAKVPNVGIGVVICTGSSNNTIGGTVTGSGNVISGNGGNGVYIIGAWTTANVVEGNDIGLNAQESQTLPNVDNGVYIGGEATSNTIGGTSAGAGNVISGNSQSGVVITDSGTKDNVVAGDDIGTNSTGSSLLGNDNGVVIQNGAENNTIGGTTAGARDVISDNSGEGVHIVGTGTISGETSDNVVEGDYIGTNSAGTAKLPNAENGVGIYSGASDNTIGGTVTGSGNVISGNGANGVYIVNSGTTANVVQGNDIGLSASESKKLPNTANGVYIGGGASGNTIGGSSSNTAGTLAGAGNVISGNSQAGVCITDSGTDGNVVAGSYIGTGPTGSTGLLGNYDGVVIQNGASKNTIGGTSSISGGSLAGAGNVISGNTEDGVHIVDTGTSGNQVEGDYIGVTAGGSAPLANGASGVAIYAGASKNTIGGTVSGSGDIVSGNTGDGFYITGSGTTGNVVEGDDIGTNASGSNYVRNNLGVYIGTGATNNTIGGTTAAARDVISGNSTDGVQMFGVGTAGNVVDGDYIGVNASDSALYNGASGVAIYGGASNNTVGGTSSGTLNVISGNTGDGVYISDPGTSGNVVAGDYIGTNAAGTATVPNYIGVLIQNGATGNTIGGSSSNTGGSLAGAGNVISGNTEDGVHIVDTGTNGNLVEGDYIGTTASGSQPLGNGASGVAIYAGASTNTIGGTTSGLRDVVSGNVGDAFYIFSSGTTGNVVEGDYIGTDYTGSNPVPNYIGVYIAGGASDNTIGGTSAGAGDVISGNDSNGVYIVSSGTTGNVLEGNDIGLSATESQIVPNTANGVYIGGGATGNTIGGTANVISGNNGAGVIITDSGTDSNDVLNNLIGTSTYGAKNMGNGGDGVQIENGASDSTVIESAIWYNGNNGVEIDGNSTNNTIKYDTLDNNGASGVYIAVGSSNNTIENSTIENNTWGIFDTGTDDSDTSGNTVTNNRKANYVS